MSCKMRAEIATRYVCAVQDEASDQVIKNIVRELGEHETSCGCVDGTDRWEQLLCPVEYLPKERSRAQK